MFGDRKLLIDMLERHELLDAVLASKYDDDSVDGSHTYRTNPVVSYQPMARLLDGNEILYLRQHGMGAAELRRQVRMRRRAYLAYCKLLWRELGDIYFGLSRGDLPGLIECQRQLNRDRARWALLYVAYLLHAVGLWNLGWRLCFTTIRQIIASHAAKVVTLPARPTHL